MARRYDCTICKVSAQSSRIMLPMGMYCNKGIGAVKPGDRIVLHESWRRQTVTVERVCKIPTASGYFTFELHGIYGERMTWEALSGEWRDLCLNEGLGPEAFDPATVLLVEYRL